MRYFDAPAIFCISGTHVSSILLQVTVAQSTKVSMLVMSLSFVTKLSQVLLRHPPMSSGAPFPWPCGSRNKIRFSCLTRTFIISANCYLATTSFHYARAFNPRRL